MPPKLVFIGRWPEPEQRELTVALRPHIPRGYSWEIRKATGREIIAKAKPSTADPHGIERSIGQVLTGPGRYLYRCASHGKGDIYVASNVLEIAVLIRIFATDLQGIQAVEQTLQRKLRELFGPTAHSPRSWKEIDDDDQPTRSA